MKTLTFTMEDALISLKGLAILTGADLIHAGQANGKKKSDNTNDIYTVSAHSTVQVEATKVGEVTIKTDAPIDPKRALYIMKLDPNGEMSGVPVKIATDSIGPRTEGSVTITSNLIEIGDIIFVDFYQLYEEDAVLIDITPDQFGGYFYLEGSTLFKRELDGKDLPAEIIIPKVKIQSNFTFTLASSGDPSTFTFTMDAFPDYAEHDKTKKVLCSIQVLNADDNYDGGEVEDANYGYTRVTYDDDTEGAYFAKIFTSESDAEMQTDDDQTGAYYQNDYANVILVLVPDSNLVIGEQNTLVVYGLINRGTSTEPSYKVVKLNPARCKITSDSSVTGVTINSDNTISVADTVTEGTKVSITIRTITGGAGKTQEYTTIKKN